MKIFLNLLAAKQGGQVTRAIEFINRFETFSAKDDYLFVLISNLFPLKIKNKKRVKIIKIHFFENKLNFIFRFIWENIKLHTIIKNIKADVYLTFSHSLPLLSLKLPTIVGLSNLAPFSKSAFINETILGKMRLLLLKSIIIFSTEKASAVIALSEEGKFLLIKHGINRSKIIKILIGVKTRKNLLQLVNSRKKYILYVSHFYRYKNFEQLILAYSKLSGHIISKFRLKLVGNFSDKTYVQSLQQMSQKIAIDHKIDFINGIAPKKLNSIYKNASLFVFPSRIENCPNIILEAMSFGLPILSTKTPPMPEFTKKSAKFFNIDDSTDLAKKIDKLLNSQIVLNKMRKLSFTRSNIYSWDLFTKQVIDLCKKKSVKPNN
jgi:glycosyltransferase involved in cell wall biosynthesis